MKWPLQCRSGNFPQHWTNRHNCQVLKLLMSFSKKFIGMLDSWLSQSDGIFVSYHCCSSCHKFSDLKLLLLNKNLKLYYPYSSRHQKVWNQFYWELAKHPQDLFLSEISGENPFPCLFQLFQVACIPCLPHITSTSCFHGRNPTTDSDPPAFFLWGSSGLHWAQ